MSKHLLGGLLSLSLFVFAGCGVNQSDITPPTETPASGDVVSLSGSEDVLEIPVEDNPAIPISGQVDEHISSADTTPTDKDDDSAPSSASGTNNNASDTPDDPSSAHEDLGLTIEGISPSSDDSLVYTNTEYGFQITLPEGWSDYKIFHRDYDKNLTQGLVDMIEVGIPTQSPRPTHYSGRNDTHTQKIIYAGVVIVMIRTHEGYENSMCENFASPACMPQESVLGHNDRYYFTLLAPNDYPDDIYAKSTSIDQNRQKTFDSFKIL